MTRGSREEEGEGEEGEKEEEKMEGNGVLTKHTWSLLYVKWSILSSLRR